MGQSGLTVQDWGCAMVCTAMILVDAGKDTNPYLLNQWLSANGGYDADGSIVWSKPAEYSGGRLEHVESLGWSSGGNWAIDNDHWAELKAALDQGCLVVVKVDSNTRTPGLDQDQHWVLVTGFAGGEVENPANYPINDPDPGELFPTLEGYRDATYDNTFFAMRVYRKAGGGDPPPPPPVPLTPGTAEAPGSALDTPTPELQWEESEGADNYALAISRFPYGSANIVYSAEGLAGSSHTVPAGVLTRGERYRWNMQAHGAGGWSEISATLYFQVEGASLPGNYDRAAAVNYAAKYWDKVVSDGFYWIAGDVAPDGIPQEYPSGTGVDVVQADLDAMPGDWWGVDCAHFVSCCIGSEPHERGGGLPIPGLAGMATYGLPGAPGLIEELTDTDTGLGVDRGSWEELEQGDVIGYDWQDDGKVNHVALYVGDGHIAAHSDCYPLDTSWDVYGAQGHRFIHIVGGPAVPVVTAGLAIAEAPPYQVGDTVTATFSIANQGSAAITLAVLTAGGRDPDDRVADFTFATDVSLAPGETYDYQGELVLAKAGSYHFFCAYRNPDGTWNTAIPAVGGANNVLDISVSLPPVDADLSGVAATTTHAADGADACTVTVTCVNPDGTPISGFPGSAIAFVVFPDEGVALLQPFGNTDAAGRSRATFATTIAGTKTIQVEVAGDYPGSVILSDQPQVVFHEFGSRPTSLDVRKPPASPLVSWTGPSADAHAQRGQWFQDRLGGGESVRTHEFYDNVGTEGGADVIFGRAENVQTDPETGFIVAFDIVVTITHPALADGSGSNGGVNILGESLDSQWRHAGMMLETVLTAEFAIDSDAGPPPGGDGPYRDVAPHIVAQNHDRLAWYGWTPGNGDPDRQPSGSYCVPAWDMGDIPCEGMSVTRRLKFVVDNGGLSPEDPRFAAIMGSAQHGFDLLANRTSSLKVSRWLDDLVLDAGAAFPHAEGLGPFQSSDCSVFHNAALPLSVAAWTDQTWVYQNTQTTTQDRHTSLATIALVSEAEPGEAYTITVADDGPGTNFTLGTPVDNRPGEDTLTVEIIGGRIGASTHDTGGLPYTVTLTVQGQTSLESDTAEVELVLRQLGDVDGSGSRVGLDKQYFNQRLNNVATPFADRAYDLDGDGNVIGLDKQWMNLALNNVPLE